MHVHYLPPLTKPQHFSGADEVQSNEYQDVDIVKYQFLAIVATWSGIIAYQLCQIGWSNLALQHHNERPECHCTWQDCFPGRMRCHTSRTPRHRPWSSTARYLLMSPSADTMKGRSWTQHDPTRPPKQMQGTKSHRWSFSWLLRVLVRNSRWSDKR